MNPVVEFLSRFYRPKEEDWPIEKQAEWPVEKVAAKELRERQSKEMEMWNHWNTNGRQPEHLEPLVNSFRPLINSKVNVYTTKIRDIPPEAIRAEFMNQFVQAMQTYNPDRGPGLGTHVQHQLKKA